MTDAGRAALDKLRQEAPDESLPWGGRSPRVLTKAYKRFTLRDETTTVDECGDWGDALIDEQYRRFTHGS